MTALCDLAAKTCEPCKGGVPPLTPTEIAPLHAALGADWQVVEHHHLHRKYGFPDFATALTFVNAVGAVAEAEGHHPDITLAWGRVEIDLYTHKIDGLAEADFVLAAKIEQLPR